MPSTELCICTLDLLLESINGRGHQATKAKFIAFLRSERSTFVKVGCVEEGAALDKLLL